MSRTPLRHARRDRWACRLHLDVMRSYRIVVLPSDDSRERVVKRLLTASAKEVHDLALSEMWPSANVLRQMYCLSRSTFALSRSPQSLRPFQPASQRREQGRTPQEPHAQRRVLDLQHLRYRHLGESSPSWYQQQQFDSRRS